MRLDKVIITPKSYSYNGIIKSADLWIMVKGVYQKVSSIDVDLSFLSIQIDFEKVNEKQLLIYFSDNGNGLSDKFIKNSQKIFRNIYF